MGALVTSNPSTALAAYGGVNPWAEAGRDVESGAYLKFNGNTGEVTFGSDDTELPVGSLIVVDMQSLAFGWICWVESQVEEEVLVRVIDGKAPLEHELKDHGPYNDDDDGWRQAASFSAVILEYGTGPDATTHESVGTRLLFKTSTGGPVRSTKKLAGAYGKLFLTHPDEMPVVEIDTESYIPKVKKHGKKWSLLFKIADWIGEDELAGLVQGEVDDERDYAPEPEPVAAPEPVATGRRRSAAPAAAEPAAEAAPRRRAAAAPVEEAAGEEEEAPAPAAPAGRRRAAAAAPAEEASADEDEAPAPRRRTTAAAAEVAPEDEDGGNIAPEPRGRSAGRAAAPNARVRRF